MVTKKTKRPEYSPTVKRIETDTDNTCNFILNRVYYGTQIEKVFLTMSDCNGYNDCNGNLEGNFLTKKRCFEEDSFSNQFLAKHIVQSGNAFVRRYFCSLYYRTNSNRHFPHRPPGDQNRSHRSLHPPVTLDKPVDQLHRYCTVAFVCHPCRLRPESLSFSRPIVSRYDSRSSDSFSSVCHRPDPFDFLQTVSPRHFHRGHSWIRFCFSSQGYCPLSVCCRRRFCYSFRQDRF